jgi:hypothetical protein
MKWDKSEWKISQDILFTLVLCASPIIGVTFLASFFHGIANARQGNPTIYWIAFSLAVFGLVLLFFAKLPLYRQGKFLTFGSKELPDKYKGIYRIAYYSIGVSLVIMLLMLAMLR